MGINWNGILRALRGVAMAAAALGLLAACDDDPTGPGGIPAGMNLVGLSVSIGSPGGAALAPALMAQGLELTDGVNTLVIESAEVVVREIKFERVETAGCDSTVDDDDCEEYEVGPFLVPLPLDGSVSSEIEAVLEAGVYDEIELKIHKPEDDDVMDSDFLTDHPGFTRISVRVTGTYNDAPFTYTSDLDEEQEIELIDPLVVTESSAPENVTLTIDISTWFVGPGDLLIDPATANDGEPNESLVEDNIQASIEGFRDDDEDGVPHGDDSDEEDDS